FSSFHVAAPIEIYTLSLHDALPIYRWLGAGPNGVRPRQQRFPWSAVCGRENDRAGDAAQHQFQRQGPTHRQYAARGDGLALDVRSEEHTSELQSRGHLVCRLLLEKK